MSKFLGKWKITEMEQWDQEYIDLVEPGYIELRKDNLGEFVFGTVKGFIDLRIKRVHGKEKAEFSWEGTSEYDPICGRGWFKLNDEDELEKTRGREQLFLILVSDPVFSGAELRQRLNRFAVGISL